MSAFYLVQRLESRNPFSADKGFDGFFSLEYMGSSEFEWGAVPRALTSMRTSDAVVEAAEVSINGRTGQVYFVGHVGVSEASKAMEAWATGGFTGKERTQFPEAFAGEESPFHRSDAWWDIEQNVAWALDETKAVQLAAAFNSRPLVKS